MTDIWVVLEHTNGTLHEQSGELLSDVSELARQQHSPTTTYVILLRDRQEELPNISLLTHMGVQHLYLVEHFRLARYSTEDYVVALSWLLKQHQPTLLVTGATPDGRDWTPRLAAQLRLPCVPNCLGIQLHDDTLLALRSIYEGRAYVQTRTELHKRTAVVTLLPGVRGAAKTHVESEHVTRPVVTRLTPELRTAGQAEEKARVRHIALQAPSPEEVELDAAERIVAGGRGVGQEGFATIAAFAHRLGAAVGATRVATDLGWIEHARQIGATGKIVRPKLYIACGISGAAQHTSGMTESQTVVAINPDRAAPIFALADLGLLGDANKILPLAAEHIS